MGEYTKTRKGILMKTTKSSLVMSAIAITLCIAMLAGTTLAWFTDSAVSGGNIIHTGTLDVEMYWADEINPTTWNDASQGAIFTHEYWEPGYTEVKYIKIVNAGDLNIKWKLTVEADGQVTYLSDAIDVYYVNPVTNEITSLNGLTAAGTLTEVMAEKTNSTGSLVPEQETVLAVVFHMQENASNKYQGMTLCEDGFSVKLVAAQDVGESDAFDDQYDADADWGEGSVNFAASTALDSGNIVHGALVNNVTIGTADGINAIVPANVKVADGATKLDLTVKAMDTESNITIGDGESAKTLDVHIDGIAANNTQPIVVNLGKFMDPGLDDTSVKMYHTENGIPTLMTRVASEADFAIHNQFTYDPATGNVSIYIASFSAITATTVTSSKWDGTVDIKWYKTDRNEFNILTASEFAGFRAIVDGGYYDKDRNWVAVTQDSFAGKTVNLAVDIDLQGKLFDPIGKGYAHKNGQVFMGTFDGKGHTIYNLYQNGWDLDPNPGVYDTYTYSTAGGGLFASIMDATIKNLTISDANITFECVDMGFVAGYAQGQCNFENIIITGNSTIANYNRYTGGIVGEVCFGTQYNEQGYSHVFRNIVVDSTVTVSSLWGSFDTSCGGVIGGKWGDAKVLMQNVMVACTMDVFSDVTAAYQWYAYRRCGMLIGNTEEPAANGKNAYNAEASFLTCSNVDVYYGDWINYHYYQFNNQDSGTGRNYPWVRAEEGKNNGAFSNPRYGVPTHGGVKVTEDPNMESKKTDYTPIVFNQLYGGGQGVYGCANHTGVTTHELGSTAPTTIYVHNNLGWSNLRVKYWLAHKDDNGNPVANGIWTTINESGIAMGSMETATGAYKIDLPHYAYKVQIIGNDGAVASADIFVSELTSGSNYTLTWTHAHTYNQNGTCTACGDGHDCLKFVTGVTCDQSKNCSQCGKEVRLEHDYKYVATDAGTGHQSAFHHQFSYQCTKCGEEMKSFTVGSGTGEINTFTMPHETFFACNRWNSGGQGASKGKFGNVQYDSINKVYYTRVHLANGGSFEFINNSNIPDNADVSSDGSDPKVTQTIYGTGKYAVIKMRVGANEEYLRFAALDGVTGESYVTDDILAAGVRREFQGGWAVYVIDLTAFSSTYTANKSYDAGGTKAWFGFMGDSTGGTLIYGNDPNSSLDDTIHNYDADDYVDIAYFAVCDNEAEIAKIVTDETVIYTNWKTPANDEQDDYCDHEYAYTKSGNFYQYQCTTCHTIKASFQVGKDGINMFSVSQDGVNFASNRYNANHMSTTKGPFENAITEGGVTFNRIYFDEHGSFEFLNGIDTPDGKDNTLTQTVYGSGNFMVLRLRAGAGLPGIGLGIIDGTGGHDKMSQENDWMMTSTNFRNGEDISNEWTTYVVDLSIYNKCAAFTPGVESTNKVWVGMKVNGDANDHYVDIEYFALCDTWSEVYTIVGDQAVVITDWKTLNTSTSEDRYPDDDLTADELYAKVAEEQGIVIPQN